MTPLSRREYAQAVRQRYVQASRQAKRQILSEICAMTRYHRKYAIQHLNGRPPSPVHRRLRTLYYRPETVTVLAALMKPPFASWWRPSGESPASI